MKKDGNHWSFKESWKKEEEGFHSQKKGKLILLPFSLPLYSSHPSKEARRADKVNALHNFKIVLLYVFKACLCDGN